MKNLVLAFLLFFGAACAQKNTGIGYGFNGEIKVSISVSDGKIVKIVPESHNETPDIGGSAFPILEKEIIKTQSPLVDSISGATYTSFGYKSAVADAMKGAGLSSHTVLMDAPATGNTNTNQ